MPDRRGRKGPTDDLLPANIVPWAREVWRDREEVVSLPSGPWLLRKAADALGIDQAEVDSILSKYRVLSEAVALK